MIGEGFKLVNTMIVNGVEHSIYRKVTNKVIVQEHREEILVIDGVPHHITDVQGEWKKIKEKNK